MTVVMSDLYFKILMLMDGDVNHHRKQLSASKLKKITETV